MDGTLPNFDAMLALRLYCCHAAALLLLRHQRRRLAAVAGKGVRRSIVDSPAKGDTSGSGQEGPGLTTPDFSPTPSVSSPFVRQQSLLFPPDGALPLRAASCTLGTACWA